MHVVIADLPEPFRAMTCCGKWLLLSDHLPQDLLARALDIGEQPDCLEQVNRLLDCLDADAAEVAEPP